MARFKKGQSGNLNGRPKGKTGKWSNARLAEELSKGDSASLKAVQQLIQSDSETGATKLRAAIAWLDKSLEMRKRLEDEIMNELKKERERVALEIDKEKLAKLKGESTEEEEDSEEDYAPLVSLRAIKGGSE